MRTRVKICGFTQVDDAVAAANLGVDAIGLVFYPKSKRYVSIEQAVNIVNVLPAFVSVVALFVDAKETQIRDVLSNVSIDCIQFHGDEAAEDCRIYDKPFIKALTMKAELNMTEMAAQYYDASALLLDAYHPDMKGGSGTQFDWDLMPKNCALPIILAGGLHAGNAAQAIQQVKPYALDVSSGVEVDKGVKGVAKMAAFIKAINKGDG